MTKFNSADGPVVFALLVGYDNGPKGVEIYAFYKTKVIISTAMNKGKSYVRFTENALPPLLEMEVKYDN